MLMISELLSLSDFDIYKIQYTIGKKYFASPLIVQYARRNLEDDSYLKIFDEIASNLDKKDLEKWKSR